MKITDMTDTAFDQAMQRLLGDVQFWCIRLSLSPVLYRKSRTILVLAATRFTTRKERRSGNTPWSRCRSVTPTAAVNSHSRWPWRLDGFGTMRRVANPGQKRSRRLSRISVSFSGPIPAAVVTISRLRFGTSHWALCANWHGRVKH